MCFSQTLFRIWLVGQIVIDGKGISDIEDSEFSMTIKVGLLIQTLIIDIIFVVDKNNTRRKVKIQNVLKNQIKNNVSSSKSLIYYEIFLSHLF